MKKLGRPSGTSQPKYKFDYRDVKKNYTQLAVATGMSEMTIRHWFRYGVPENQLGRFCVAAGIRNWTDSVQDKVG